MKIEFEKQFGEGVDPWHEKAKRYVRKKVKNPYLLHLIFGFIEWLKQKWIDVKVANTMRDIDAQAEDGIRDCLLSRGLGDVYKRQKRYGKKKINLRQS